jgi:hypothetical protein
MPNLAVTLKADIRRLAQEENVADQWPGASKFLLPIGAIAIIVGRTG